MNKYCELCNEYCEEQFPTYMCKYQIMNKTIEEIVVKLDNIKNEISNIDLKEPEKVKEKFMPTLGTFGCSIDSKLIMISLLVSFCVAYRQKNGQVGTKDCLKKIIDEKLFEELDSLACGSYIDNLVMYVDEFAFGVTKGNTFGLKSFKEIKEQVNKTLKKACPF